MNFNKEEIKEAKETILKLAFGVPILDENGKLIGWIEKPDLNALKYIDENSSENEIYFHIEKTNDFKP